MLLTIEKVLLLKRVPMFAATPEHSLVHIAGALEEMELPAGEVLMRQGGLGTTMYLIVEGQVGVEKDGRQVDTIGAGDVVGELGVLDPEPRTATIRALTDCYLLSLEREPLFELLSEWPEVTQGVVRFLIRRYGRRPAAGPSEAQPTSQTRAGGAKPESASPNR